MADNRPVETAKPVTSSRIVSRAETVPYKECSDYTLTVSD